MRTVDKSKRAAIVEAAARVFLEKGYEGTSMELVARAAKVARRTVYNQYVSKEALFTAVTEHVWSKYDLARQVRTGGGARESIAALAAAIVKFWMDSDAIAFLRLVVAEGDRFPHLAPTFFDSGKQPVFRALVAEIRRLKKAGLLIVDDIELAAKQLVGLLNEPLMWPRLLQLSGPPAKARRDAVIESAIEVFLRAHEPK
jgi:AcrR family transcriptional regulator